MRSRYWSLIAGMGMLVALPAVARAQADRVRAELVAIAALKPPGLVAATVNGKPIDVAEVNRLVKLTLRNRPASKAALPGLEGRRSSRSLAAAWSSCIWTRKT